MCFHTYFVFGKGHIQRDEAALDINKTDENFKKRNVGTSDTTLPTKSV